MGEVRIVPDGAGWLISGDPGLVACAIRGVLARSENRGLRLTGTDSLAIAGESASNQGVRPSQPPNLKLAGDSAPVTLDEHLDGWDEAMRTRLGFSDIHRTKSLSAVRRLLDGNEWTDPMQINAAETNTFLAKYIAEGKPGARVTARKLADQYRGFGEYLRVTLELDDNPFRDVQIPRARKGRKRKGARSFKWEEACRLIATAQRREVAHWQGRQHGPSRSTFYIFLLYTGLRYSEARRQEWADIDLEEATIILTADKADRNDRIPLARDLLATLRTWRTFSTGPRVFPVGVSHHTLLEDMEEAGVPGKDEGKSGQWHRWRKTLGTQCGRSDVNPSVAHKILRHATADLTLGAYTDLELGELREGMKKLPSVKDYSCPPAPTEYAPVGLHLGPGSPMQTALPQHGIQSATTGWLGREREDLAVAASGGASRSVAGESKWSRGESSPRLDGRVEPESPDPTMKGAGDARSAQDARGSDLPGMRDRVLAPAVGSGQGLRRDLLLPLPQSVQSAEGQRAASPDADFNEAGAGQGGGARQHADSSGRDGTSTRLYPVREDGQGGRAPRGLREAGSSRVSVPLLSHEAAPSTQGVVALPPPGPGQNESTCGFRYYPANGEYVSPCHKPAGHGGEHEGHCLGSRAVWTSDQPAEHEDDAATAADKEQQDNEKSRLAARAEQPVARGQLDLLAGAGELHVQQHTDAGAGCTGGHRVRLPDAGDCAGAGTPSSALTPALPSRRTDAPLSTIGVVAQCAPEAAARSGDRGRVERCGAPHAVPTEVRGASPAAAIFCCPPPTGDGAGSTGDVRNNSDRACAGLESPRAASPSPAARPLCASASNGVDPVCLVAATAVVGVGAARTRPAYVSQPDGADGRFNIDRAQLAHDLTATHNRWLDLVARLLSALVIAALTGWAVYRAVTHTPIQYTDTNTGWMP